MKTNATGKAPRLLAIGILLSAPPVLGDSPTLPQPGAIPPGGSQLSTLKSEFVRPIAAPAAKVDPAMAAKVELGQMLFFDPRLSGNGVISCARCHNPALGWSDGLPTALGNMSGHRHTPTILDVVYSGPYFWDGRASTLQEQAKGPLTSAAEMNMPAEKAVSRIKSIPRYVAAFDRAFPGTGVTIDTIAGAIAAYEGTIVSGKAPFDRWVAGDEQAIPEEAKRGFVLFNGKANCAACHSGWRMTDDGFHDIGLAGDDLGRAGVAPGIVQLQHAFKTPTLRNINERGPYMHDGSIATLSAVIDHYDRGFVSRPSLDPEVHRLNLSVQEKKDLLAFLDTLTSTDAPVVIPVLPR